MWIRVLLVCLFLPLLGGVAAAGQLEAGDGRSCRLSFTGEITAGDAAALARVVPAINPSTSQSTYDNWLCLDSPGGSLAEALRMGQVLRAGGMGTRILANRQCMSACAILFMSGSVFDPDVGFNSQIELSNVYPYRMMHVTARLGFHRPSIRLDTDQLFDAEQVERSFDVSTEASLELVRLVGRGILATDLVEEMFSHRGQDFFYIDTVGKSLRWNIFADGEVLPRLIDSRAAFHACTALVQLETTSKATDIPYRPGTVEIIKSPRADGLGVMMWVNPEPDKEYAFNCLVGLSSEAEQTLVICGYYGPKLRRIGPFRCDSVGDVSEFFWQPTSFTSVYALPLDTPLAAMATTSRKIEVRARSEFARSYPHGRDAFRRRCVQFQGRVEIGDVQNFVTMRAAPSFDAAVVSQLPLRSLVQAPDDNQSRFEMLRGANTGACEQLCQSSFVIEKGSADWRALNACYDNHAIWYPVFDHDYQRGYVSGKFLRY
ncbi:hypothetical protein PGB28_20085 [Primorskyibacter aestuariivivens]|uniref:COG3904 family protein n=1 Tax=Primorskyibacter aestuariivivens TaxID=1888912 RepID=UPI002300131D|nr:hypothetical protein [Primorskyibacter aestuariivivens]MDA7430767.1 hypothetical protein [Primorskyibacter aestuariivivens]